MECEKHFQMKKILNIYPNVFENGLFFSITKSEHLHVRVNLDLNKQGCKWFKGHGFSGPVVFAFKEPYKYGCNISL